MHHDPMSQPQPAPDASPPSEAQLAQRNLIAFSRALTRWSGRGAFEASAGAVLCAGGSWIPVVANGAYRADDALAGAELVERADAFFGGLARGYTIKVRDNGDDEDLRQACLAAGLDAFGEAAPEMLCLAPLPDRAVPEGVSVRWIDDEAGLRDFVAVNAEAYATYGMPAEVIGELFDDAAVVLDETAAHFVVACRDEVPVAAAMAFESDGVASVQWVGTVPASRGTGLGAYVTTLATNLAFTRGASSVSLQASPMGAPIYRALGYQTIWHYTEYVRWPTPPAA
jgi:GNAT superfamily N-acetyltransferase